MAWETFAWAYFFIMEKTRVVVAMSGGVDSSVAAALLQKQGFEAVGITMCFNLPDAQGKHPSCCGVQAIEDARRVAQKLGIRHYVVNMQRYLTREVIDNFCLEYSLGRTPNPCIRCNEHIKFGVLLDKARALDAWYLATGHYAQVVKVAGGMQGAVGYMLKKAKDKKKDQSYFLYRLNQAQLTHTLFPLGNYTKDKVRSIARKYGFAVADKADSQEICFLPDMNYRDFIKTRISRGLEPGLVVDARGNSLGEHKGIALYTIGQRQGLGIAKGYPLYITRINPQDNTITVGTQEDVFSRECLLKDLHLNTRSRKKMVAAKVRIRYNHKEAQAKVFFGRKEAKVVFVKPQFAITPGQSAVFYNKDIVLGGGVIDSTLGENG